MKILEKTFEMNADKCGNHTFTQVRREGNVCMYRRNRVTNNRLHSVEVFLAKVIKAGAKLPGGGVVMEDYEQYPGASMFGRSAWSTGTVESGTLIFSRLLKKQSAVADEDTTADVSDETEIVNVMRVVKPQGERRKLNFPSGPFTQKELASFNGIDNYKEVYTDLQRGLANGTLKISVQTKEVTRGRAAKMFEVVKA